MENVGVLDDVFQEAQPVVMREREYGVGVWVGHVGIGFFEVEVGKGRLVIAIYDRKAPPFLIVGQAWFDAEASTADLARRPPRLRRARARE